MSSLDKKPIDVASFSIVDNVIFMLCIAISFVIAIWTAFKNNSTTQDFFTARKSMGIFPVAMSVLSTYTSSFMITAIPGEVYGYGLEISISYLGGVIGMIICVYMNLKVFYDLKIATVFEYFEIRYKSYGLRICLMLLQALGYIITLGISIYTPSLIISTVTPVDLTTSIFIVGIVCAFYSTIGGMRGVIWIDTFMMVVIFVGLLVITIVGILNIGASEIWTTASEGGRTRIFNFNPSLYQRQNFYYLLANGFLIYGKQYGTSQMALQRILSSKSFGDYKRSLIIIAFSFVGFHAMLMTTGIVAYATYVNCDPLSDGKIQKIDQILPYYITDKLSYIQGVPGLFLAALVCAAASTLSSFMNSLSNVFYCDLLCKFKFFQNLSERVALMICRTLTILTAVPGIGLALLVSKVDSLLPFIFVTYGLVNGPSYGLFFLALLFPMSNLIGVFVGFFTSMAVLAWMIIGSLVYKSKDEYLPLSTDICNSTAYNDTFWSLEDNFHSTPSTNQSFLMSYTNETSMEKSIYDVSYAFYSIFGTVICVLVGLCASYLSGAQKVENVPEELISPIVRRFYYKRKENKENEEPQEMNLDQYPNNETNFSSLSSQINTKL